MRPCTSEPASPHVDIARGRGRVGSGERAPIFIFLPLDCVGEVFSYMAFCIFRDWSRSSKRLILSSGLVVGECSRFRCYVRSYRVQSTMSILSARSLSQGRHVFNNKLYFALAKRSRQCLVEHSIVGERAPSRLCGGYSVEAGGFLPATVGMTHPANTFRRVMRSQAPA